MSFRKLGEPDQGGNAVKPASSNASTERRRRETVSLIFLTGRRACCLRNDSEKGLEEQHSTHPAVQYSRTPAYYVSYATTPAMDPSPPLRGLVECVVLVALHQRKQNDPFGDLRAVNSRRRRQRDLGIGVDGVVGDVVGPSAEELD